MRNGEYVLALSGSKNSARLQRDSGEQLRPWWVCPGSMEKQIRQRLANQKPNRESDHLIVP